MTFCIIIDKEQSFVAKKCQSPVNIHNIIVEMFAECDHICASSTSNLFLFMLSFLRICDTWLWAVVVKFNLDGGMSFQSCCFDILLRRLGKTMPVAEYKWHLVVEMQTNT